MCVCVCVTDDVYVNVPFSQPPSASGDRATECAADRYFAVVVVRKTLHTRNYLMQTRSIRTGVGRGQGFGGGVEGGWN